MKKSTFKRILSLITILFFITYPINAANISSTGTGGNWSDAATWVGGVVPGTSDDVTIVSGATVTLDQDVSVLSLSINGSLVIGNNTIARSLSVTNTTNIASGGSLTVGAYNITHTIVFQGTVTNDGQLNLYNNSSQLANVTFDASNGSFAIDGSSTPVFNSVTFTGGTISAGITLDINGAVIIEDAATFDDGNLIHTVAGNWTENGTGQRIGSGTIQMDATLIQSITTTATFHNLIYNGGGIGVIAGNIIVNNNFTINNNTSVQSAANNTFQADFNVADGSKYTATAGRASFNGSGNQTITIGTTDGNSNTEFYQAYFQTGGTKTIVGNLIVNNTFFLEAGVTIDDQGDTYTHTFSGNDYFNGTCNFSGSLIFKGGTLSDTDNDDFTLGTAQILIKGYTYIANNDIMRVNNNLTVDVNDNGGHTGLIINDGAQLIGTSTYSLTINNNTSLYIRGANNFPTSFGTINLEQGSYVRYDAALNDQTVNNSVSYWHLYLNNGTTKTATGNIDVNGNLYLYNGTEFLLGNYDMTLAGNIVNTDDNWGNGSLTATGGTVTLDAADANQYIYIAGSGSYTFNNLVLTNTAPTTVRGKYFRDNITVNGNFYVNNTGGNSNNILIVDIDDHEITGGNDFSLGANVELRTSGVNAFGTMMTSFSGTKTLNTNSTIRFDKTDGDQQIPGSITYGNIALYGSNKKTVQSNLTINGSVSAVGYTPVLTANSYNILVAGDWNMSLSTTDLTGTNIVAFNGADQSISQSKFNTVYFMGSGTKTISGQLDILKDLNIQDDAIVQTDQYIYIEGNWAETDNSQFRQSGGRVTFDGTTANQTISMNSGSYFYNLTIDKTGSNKTVTANSNIDINGTFNFTENNAIFDLNGNNLYVARDFYFRDGCSFIHNNGKVYFDGNDIAQLIRNYNPNTIVFFNTEFSGTAVKRLYDNSFKFEGDVFINNTILDGQNWAHYVEGNWINTGIFRHSNTLYFNGAKDQSISSSSFHSVRFGGGNYIKTLTGDITLNGSLYIDDATLDVSANNYSITLDDYWHNDSTGSFIAQQGTVTLTGEYNRIFTGQTNTAYNGGQVVTQGGTKDFYNLTINASGEDYWMFIHGDLTVKNNFKIIKGRFYQSYDPNTYGINDIYIGGDFINTGSIYNNNYGEKIELNPTSGNHIFNPGNSNTYSITVFNGAAGTSYTFESDFNLYNNRDITINNGYIDLNSHKIITNASGGNITINGGTLEVDSAAVISMGDGSTLTNSGGTFMLTGHTDNPASLIATTGNYTFVQTSGTIAASNYHIEATSGNGIDIQGGSIDNTNTFQNGSFSSGTGTAYLTVSGIDLGGDRTINDVTFNSGTSYNVQRTSGNGAMNFVNATGSISGEAYENDNGTPGTLINWTYPGAVYWDGNSDGDGDNIHWNDPLNWASDAVPTNTSQVILDHSYVSGTYTVEISSNNAVAKSVFINSGSSQISLLLNGYELVIDDDITIGANSVLTQTTATDTITIGGSWSNEGTFNEGTSTVKFNPTTGTHTITTQGAGDAFYNIVIDGIEGTNIVSSQLDINGSLELKGGILNAGSNTITVAGNWSRTGGAVFNVGTSTVIFDGNDQTINGGEFYNLITSNSGTKTITANIDVKRDITIGNGTVLDGGINTIYIGDDWTNEVGNSGFTQSGTGTVIFNGEAVNQDICSATTQPTTFNNLIISGTRTKYTRQNITITGDLIINSASLYIVDGTSINGVGTNTLNMSNGRIYVNGASNFPQNFETINLSGGTIDYYANINQTIYPTTYYNLMMQRINSGNLTTKTLAGDIDVKGSLYIYDDDTEFDVSGYTILLQGGLNKVGSTRPIIWGATGTVIHYGGSWTLDTDINTLNNVIKKNTGYLRIRYHSIEVTGNMSILEDAYLQQDTVNITCTGSGKTFTLAATAYVNSYNPETFGGQSGRKAFPVGFANYNLHKNSRVYLRGTVGDQLIYTTPDYGNLYIQTNAQINLSLDGDLNVEGDFRMNYDTPVLIDNGYNINIAGSYIDIRNYSPSSSSILTFDGADQRILDAGTGATIFDMNNVVFAGSGQKSLYNGGDDWYNITGDLTINSNVTVYIPRRLDFSGTNWTNNGTFNNTGYVVNFTGASLQTIDPGQNNDFYAVSFSGSGQKEFVGNGINVNNGTFTIENGASVNMNNLTHYIASTRITNNGGTWTTDNASFVWDRNGTQYIPSMNCQDMTFRRYDQWTRLRYLEGNINIDDLTIEEGVQLRCSESNETSTPTYNVTMTGNFINNGTLYAWGNTFAFESNNTDTKVIKQGSGSFDNVTFNQNSFGGQNTRTYTLIEETRFYEDMTIGKGATLDLNGQILRLGNDDPNDPVEPNAEQHLVQDGATLDIDAGASLLFSCRDAGNPKLDIESGATLKIVGTNGNNAIISSTDWYSNAHRIDINILSGATVYAQYYNIKYLTDEGLEVASGAIIDPTNNFSDGTWSEINTSTSGTHYYFYCNADVSGIGSVNNLSFNFNGTPIAGVHFNVKRDASSTGVLTFGGNMSGLLAGSTYEADDLTENNTSSSLIDWPPISEVYWTGAISSDWFTAANWSPAQVPDINTNAVIPSQANSPVINGQDAVCKDLKITDGFLSLLASYNLTVGGDVYLGSGSNVGILAVDNAGSNITVAGSWTRAQNAIFVHGDGNVIFNALGGSVSIDPRSSAFGNLTINGGATFLISRSEVFVDNNLTILSGTLSPNINNYILHIKGNFENSGGNFDNSITGTVLFDGNNNQTITNGDFTNVTIDGSGTKTTVNTCNINGVLNIVNGVFAGGDVINMDGNVIIEATGGFNDGGFTHTFSGYRWTSAGSYAGSGTIEFDRSGTQYINGGLFNNLVLKNNGSVNLENDVNLTGNLSIIEPNTYFNVQTYQVTNTSSTGTFSMGDNRIIYIRGANNFPSGFSNYLLNKNSYTFYDGTMQQTIAPVPVVYGRLYIDNSAKILGGHLDINGRLYFYNDASLDVTSNNYRINIEGDWYNYYGATFIPREGEVIFDGNNNYTYLRIYDESKDTNPFYKLTVNKGAGELRSLWTDISIQNNLRVLNGILYQSQTMYISGDMSAISGTFAAVGTYYLNKVSGTSNLQLNGSVLNNLTINSGASYILQDDLLMNGQFNLINGVFDGNGNTVRMGNYGEVNEISGLYKIGSGGVLQLPNYGTLKVNSGGEIWVVGDVNNIATVTNYNGRYYFNVENGATIRAKYYLFEYMAENGIYIKDGAIINANYNFSYGTFANPANGGACLRIENTQEFTESNNNPILEVSFPLNPGGGASNVVKTNAASGTLDFKNFSGEFAGEDFDNDPNNLINWISPPYIVWTGNVDNNWYDAGNWEVSYGADRIPLISDNVIIQQRTNQPIIDQDGALAKTLEIQENATLTLNSALATDTTLIVAGDILISGRLVMSSGNDTLAVRGNWTNTGMFTAGTATVILNASSGIQTVDNYNDYFYNLYINTADNVQISRNTIVNNEFKIINGTFDMTANNRLLTVKGDFINTGNFISQSAKLILAGTGTTQNFNPGNSSFYNIDINANSGTTVLLTGNVLSLSHNMNINSGTFDLNNNVFNFGDASGTDVLTIEGGTLVIDENAYLKPANSASVEVNSGGTIKFVGTNIDNPAYLQSQSGSYSFSVNSGATIHAKYYNFQNMDSYGIRLQAGALIDASNNFSDGVWLNGTNPGQYLWLENDFSDYTVTGVYFHNGASVNVKRLSGSGIITFKDALGLLAGVNYEDDNPANGETTGNIRWSYTHVQCVWNGSTDSDWDKTSNWDNNQVPDANSTARIPDVSLASGNMPVIGITSGSNNATCYDLIIESGATLTLGNSKNLDVNNTITIASGATLKVNSNSNSQINVADIWSIDGTFDHGNIATVVFDAPGGKLLTISGNTSFYNLEINSSGNAEYLTGNPLTIDGNFTITSGIFTISDIGDTLYIGGNYTNTGTFNNGNGFVVLNGANQNILNTGVGNFYNLIIEGTNVKTLASDITIKNDLNIFTGSTLDGASYTISLSGDWVNKGTYTPSTSTIILNGSATQLIDNYNAETFYNLTVNNSASTFPQIVLYGDLYLNGNSWVMTDGIIESSSNEILSLGANIILTGGNNSNSYVTGPLSRTGSTDFVFPLGDGAKFARIGVSGLSATATFVAQYHHSSYTDATTVGAGIDHISNYEYWDFNQTSGSETPKVTLYWEDGTDSEIDNLSTLTVVLYTAGQWENMGNGGTTGTTANGTIISANNLSAFGPLSFGSTNGDNPLHSYSKWTGNISTVWNDPGNWNGGVPDATRNAIIPAAPANQPVIDINANVKQLTIEENAVLNINPLKSLTTQGRLTINGTLRLNSDANGNSSLINNDVISYGANCNVYTELYLTGWQYHYVSSPTTAATSDIFKVIPTSPNYNHNFYWYDETDQNSDWTATAWNEENGNMELMKGYAVYFDRNPTVVFDRNTCGDFNTGDKSKSLTYTGSSAAPVLQRGWNFVGNPFPAYLDWDASGWTKTNLYNSIYFWNGTNYSYYVPSGDPDGAQDGGAGTNDATSIIPPMQGFFVKVKEGTPDTDNQTGLLTAPMSARTTSTQAFWKKRKMQNTDNIIRLYASGNGYTDETLLRIVSNTTYGFDDNYDAFKLISKTPGIPQIYSIGTDTIECSISSIPDMYDNLIIPIGFVANQSGTYTLKVNDFILSDYREAYFEDKYTNETYSLEGLDYTFNSETGIFEDRFVIKFKQTVTTDFTDEYSDANIDIYSDNAYIYLKSDEPKAILGDVQVYDIKGNIVLFTKNTEEGLAKIPINVINGIYFVNFKNKTHSIIQKVIIFK